MIGWTKAMELAAAVRRGGVQEIPGLEDLMDAHEQAMTDLDRQPYVEAEKQRRRAQAGDELRVKVNALVEAARTAAMKPFDHEEGQLRAQARATGADASDAVVRGQVFRNERARQLAALVEASSTPAAVREAYAHAVLTDDADAIRLVGRAARQKLQVLASVDGGKAISALRSAALQFDAEFGTWEREHPSAVERLDQIDRGRHQAALLFDQSAEFALRLYGVNRPASAPELKPMPDVEPAGDGLQIGPGFPRIAGR